MSQPIQMQGSLVYNNPPLAARFVVPINPNYASISGKQYSQVSFTAPTTAGGTAIPLGNVSAPGWFILQNVDATNYVDILSGVSGTAFIRLMPGDFCMGRFTPAVTAPAALGHTAAVQLEGLILSQ